MKEQLRPICEIAAEIRALRNQWPQKQIPEAAAHYLGPMFSLNTCRDNYGLDTGSSVVAYFLNNANVWKGEDARRIKAELNKHLKNR